MAQGHRSEQGGYRGDGSSAKAGRSTGSRAVKGHLEEEHSWQREWTPAKMWQLCALLGSWNSKQAKQQREREAEWCRTSQGSHGVLKNLALKGF